MHLEITPEPPPHEREAVERALTRLIEGERREPRGAWWREGVREGVLAYPQAHVAWRRPSGRGAKRA
jgi:hypothetical protein